MHSPSASGSDQAAYHRALRACRCSPFRPGLFLAMRDRGIKLSQVAGLNGYQAGYTWQILREHRADQDLMWLIQVGALRREVDGQGITDSYRLTPMGRQIVEQSLPQEETNEQPQIKLRERILNRLASWSLGV